jgi:Uma2 family endonuclease
MATAALTAPESPARFTTAEFARMCEQDAFADIKVELIAGVLHRLPLNMNRHGGMQAQVIMELAEVVSEKHVLASVGIDFGNATVVACDSAVLRERDRGASGWLAPDELELVVEISEGTFDRDYGLKQRLYAGAGVSTYWVVDLMRSVVHVFDRPSEDGYLGIDLVRFGEPLAVPGSEAAITLV